MRLLKVLPWTALVLACASPGGIEYTSGRRAEVTPDGLHRIETWSSTASRVYVRPGADLHRYDKVMLEDVVVRYGMGTTRALDPQHLRKLEQTFQEVFRSELEKSAVYRLVGVPGPDVLRVVPELVDVVVTAPQQPATPDSDFYVQEAGAVTLALALTDSLSQTVLVRAYDREAVEGGSGLGYRVTPGANLANARLVFQQWAARLRSRLDSVRAIPPLPAEDAAPAAGSPGA